MYLFLLAIAFTFVVYVVLLFSHFLGDKITTFDSLADYVGKDKIIGEFPLINLTNQKESNKFNIADELMNKFIYEFKRFSSKFWFSHKLLSNIWSKYVNSEQVLLYH